MIIVLGVLLFLSLLIGLIIASLAYHILQKRYERVFMFLCGLLLVCLLLFEIIPESLESFEPVSLLLGIIIGCFFYNLSSNIHSHSQQSSIIPLFVALFLHTIPLSLTLGSLLTKSAFTLPLTTSIIIHHIPEGFALTTLFLVQQKKLTGLLLSFLSLSICFVFFVWIGKHFMVLPRIQGIIMGIFICLLGTTSLKEFILSSFKIPHNFPRFLK